MRQVVGSAFADLMAHTEIGPWYRRMQEAVGESSCFHRVFMKGTQVQPGPHNVASRQSAELASRERA